VVVGALAAAVVLGARLAPARGAPRPATPAPSAQALIARLAILRRPQTAADVVPPVHPLRGEQSGRIIAGLSRLVATESGTRLFLVVTTPAGGSPPLWSPRLGDQVAIVAVTAHGSRESWSFPAVDLSNSDQVLEAGVRAAPGPVAASAYNVSIVPDGVARVHWAFDTPSGKPGRVVDVPVANNVAISALQPSAGLLGRATWYAPDGSVVPTSDRALRHAVAVRQAVLASRAARYDAHHSYSAPPGLLDDFAVFAIASRTGVRTPGGNIISHPRLATLPLTILELTAPDRRLQLDPEDMRQVTTPSGVRVWITPGRHGICIDEVDPAPLPGRLSSGGGGSCSGTIAEAEAHGAGLTSGRPGGVTMVYQVVPIAHPTITLRTRGGHRHTIRPPDGVYVGREP
jgi:hypothetical protein